ncbi:MAG TPA: DUF1330 domain-containing protein [Azospira sp.]|nr:DUF1330 domain-containing protein [Azospira sp.]HNN08109.1 DUF1330 domain-containing protein [Azospira sp.]HNN46100.1 DUF1330 domain-containing protein [Azospira sp.]
MDACAYVVGNITVHNPDRWAEYRAQVPATLVPWQAEIVMRAGMAQVLSGTHAHTDIVVLRFPDIAAAHGWFNSPAYQALLPLRNEAATVDLVCYQG